MANHDATQPDGHGALPADVQELFDAHGVDGDGFRLYLRSGQLGDTPPADGQRCLMLAMGFVISTMADRRKAAEAAAVVAVRRVRRTATVTTRLGRVTRELRALAGSGATIEQARAVRDRYARAIGLRPGVGGDVLTEWLLSPESAAIDLEDVDERFLALGNARADPFAFARAASEAGRFVTAARLPPATRGHA